MVLSRWSNFCVKISIVKFLKEWWAQWREYLAEFLATLIFIFVASLALLSNQIYGQIGAVGISLSIGLVYTSLVFASVQSAGGYLNPAVTLALWLCGRLSHAKTVSFIVVQILASFSAAFLLHLIFGQAALQFLLGAPTLGVGVDLISAVVVEAILTAGLVFVIFATAVDRNGPVSFAPLALGLYVVAATLVALPISGAAFNPARVIGPLVLAKSYDSLAVWLIGPLGGSLMSIVYETAFLRRGRK